MKHWLAGKLRQFLKPYQSLRGFRARVEAVRVPERLSVSRALSCTVRVRNVGDRPWPVGGLNPIRLSYHWQVPGQGHYYVYDGGRRTVLPARLWPGDEAVLACEVVTPNTAGDYLLEFDLVREHVGWFGAGGSATARVPCRVDGRSAADGVEGYDYVAAYRRADLERDYWTIVGPGSRDEFEELGRGKRQLLIDLGLTPSGRVLDVGCGTGQLAQPLLDYLGPDGLYYGTDIAEEAVAFCRKKYRRPNFVFLRNEMTRVPVEGVAFDFIYLGSVFTHLYPDEIRALLEDLKRLLAAGGQVVADAFVSARVERHEGSREMVEINEAHLRRQFAACGLHCDVLHTWPWSAGVERLLYRLTHPAAASHPKAA